MRKYSKYFIALALVMLVVLGAFISCDDAVKTPKEKFWVEFEAEVNTAVKGVADVKIVDDNITVLFKDGVTVEQVQSAAESLFEALDEMVDYGKLTLYKPSKETFLLSDSNVVVNVAKHLLGGGAEAAQQFLDEGDVTSFYEAEVKYKDDEFDLAGTLKFDIAD